jgi:hypothetical protein
MIWVRKNLSFRGCRGGSLIWGRLPLYDTFGLDSDELPLLMGRKDSDIPVATAGLCRQPRRKMEMNDQHLRIPPMVCCAFPELEK